MKKKSRLFFVAVKKLTLVTILIGLVLVVYFSYLFISPDSSLRERFFGKSAKYQGLIRLWSVDTFEGGCASRSGFLNDVAMRFEKQNKGAFIMVENLTIDEMTANLKNNVYPDIFCFGTGVAGYLKDKMKELSTEVEKALLPNFAMAGLCRGKLLACPYAYGMYALLTSTARVEKAKKEVKNLKDLALHLAFDVTTKRTTKHTYSLTFGKTDYVDAQKIFSRSFDVGLSSLIENGVVDPKVIGQTPYEAYLSFTSGKSSMLLGTQRDVFRMENRVAAGVESDILIEPLKEYTDLVNYISVTSDNKDVISVCKDFVEFLLSEEMQQRLVNIGLLSPRGKIYSEGNMCTFEESASENMVVEGAF